MKYSFLVLFTLLYSILNAQSISSKYCYKSIKATDTTFLLLELTLTSDSAYKANYYSSTTGDFRNYLDWKLEIEEGKLQRIGSKINLSRYDSVANKYIPQPVKIKRRKVIFYGYRREYLSKLVKGFEMKACL